MRKLASLALSLFLMTGTAFADSPKDSPKDAPKEAAATPAKASAATPAKVTYSSDSIPSIQVRYADLNLSTEQGTLTLYRRIKLAAQQVCPVAHAGDQEAA